MRRLATLLVVVLTCCGRTPAPPAATGPNVVLIVLDSTRADRCSVDGYGRETTPALSAIAREGASFRHAWSPAGWTGPAHASIFTGLVPARHGFLRQVREYLSDEQVTLAERLAAAGYRTACFSNNLNVAAPFGLTQGFDTVANLFEDEARPYPWAPATHAAALRWAIERAKERAPFFLFVNDMEPHYPYTPPLEVAARFLPPDARPEDVAAARRIDYRELFEHNARVKPIPDRLLRIASDLYDAEIACLDAEIGRFCGELRRAGLLDDTLLVVAADHGENLGDHGLTAHMFSIHRSIRHVPLVLRYPPRFRAGTVVDEVVRLEDLAPTIFDVLGLPPVKDLDGRSLCGDLSGRISTAAEGAPVSFVRWMQQKIPVPFDPTPLLRRCEGVTDGRFDLLRYSDGHEELYDLRQDPAEGRDLASRASPDLTRMRGLLPAAKSPPSHAPPAKDD